MTYLSALLWIAVIALAVVVIGGAVALVAAAVSVAVREPKTPTSIDLRGDDQR